MSHPHPAMPARFFFDPSGGYLPRGGRRRGPPRPPFPPPLVPPYMTYGLPPDPRAAGWVMLPPDVYPRPYMRPPHPRYHPVIPYHPSGGTVYYTPAHHSQESSSEDNSTEGSSSSSPSYKSKSPKKTDFPPLLGARTKKGQLSALSSSSDGQSEHSEDGNVKNTPAHTDTLAPRIIKSRKRRKKTALLATPSSTNGGVPTVLHGKEEDEEEEDLAGSMLATLKPYQPSYKDVAMLNTSKAASSVSGSLFRSFEPRITKLDSSTPVEIVAKSLYPTPPSSPEVPSSPRSSPMTEDPSPHPSSDEDSDEEHVVLEDDFFSCRDDTPRSSISDSSEYMVTAPSSPVPTSFLSPHAPPYFSPIHTPSAPRKAPHTPTPAPHLPTPAPHTPTQASQRINNVFPSSGSKTKVQTPTSPPPRPRPPGWQTVHTEPDPQTPSCTFTVMTYNVLAPTYCTDQMFPYSPEECFDASHRVSAVYEQLSELRPDIITLQEVEQNLFEGYFKKKLSCFGYQGFYAPKTERVDGCAVFIKTSKFKCTYEESVAFDRAAVSGLSKFPEDYYNRIICQKNAGMILVLEPTETCWSGPTPPRPLVLATAHLHWNPLHSDAKLVQSVLLLEKVAQVYARLPNRPRLLLTGDFNSTPNSGVLDYLVGPGVSSHHPEWQGYSYRDQLDTVLRRLGRRLKGHYSHPFSLRDAYAGYKLPFTNFTQKWSGVIDYILAEEGLTVRRVFDPLDDLWIKRHGVQGFPNYHVPSDHVPLLVELSMGAEPAADELRPLELSALPTHRPAPLTPDRRDLWDPRYARHHTGRYDDALEQKKRGKKKFPSPKNDH